MSFDIALSGIQAINEQLNTTSNNIANAGTFGFKSSRANFSALYAGTRASGVEVSSLSQSIGKAGGTVKTGNNLDAAINGRGFFVVKDTAGLSTYTRVGIFDTNATGQLVDASGRLVQGYTVTPPSTALGAMGDLTVPTGQIPAVASTTLDFQANLSAEWPIRSVEFAGPNKTVEPPTEPDKDSYNFLRTSTVYDSLGTAHTVTQYFIKTDTNTVGVAYAVDGQDAGRIDPGLTFLSNGKLDLADPANATRTLSFTPDGADPVTLVIDYTGTTQYTGSPTESVNRANGYASGNFLGIELGTDGAVIAKYSNDERQVVGMLALATFPSEASLTAVSDTSWIASTKSGTPLYATPGTGMTGTLSRGSLENSNVDITSELVGLMTSQRNYQANSKVIQTESTMLQSLMQAI